MAFLPSFLHSHTFTQTHPPTSEYSTPLTLIASCTIPSSSLLDRLPQQHALRLRHAVLLRVGDGARHRVGLGLLLAAAGGGGRRGRRRREQEQHTSGEEAAHLFRFGLVRSSGRGCLDGVCVTRMEM